MMMSALAVVAMLAVAFALLMAARASATCQSTISETLTDAGRAMRRPGRPPVTRRPEE